MLYSIVFSTTGGMGKERTVAYKRLSNCTNPIPDATLNCGTVKAASKGVFKITLTA